MGAWRRSDGRRCCGPFRQCGLRIESRRAGQAETLTRIDQVGRTDSVAPGNIPPVETVARRDPVQGLLALHHVRARNVGSDSGRTRRTGGTARKHHQQENGENAFRAPGGLHQSRNVKKRMANTRIATDNHPSRSM